MFQECLKIPTLKQDKSQHVKTLLAALNLDLATISDVPIENPLNRMIEVSLRHGIDAPLRFTINSAALINGKGQLWVGETNQVGLRHHATVDRQVG